MRGFGFEIGTYDENLTFEGEADASVSSSGWTLTVVQETRRRAGRTRRKKVRIEGTGAYAR
jgi:hypothetical protein